MGKFKTVFFPFMNKLDEHFWPQGYENNGMKMDGI